MQGFGTGVGQTGLYLTGIGVPITGSPMQCPGIQRVGCVPMSFRVGGVPNASSIGCVDDPSAVHGDDVPSSVVSQQQEGCDD